MTEYLSLAEVATAMGLPSDTLIQMLANLGLIGSGNRPSICALFTKVAKKIAYGNGEGGHRYGWSLERVATLIREET